MYSNSCCDIMSYEARGCCQDPMAGNSVEQMSDTKLATSHCTDIDMVCFHADTARVLWTHAE